MALFLKNVSFHGILLDALFEEGNREWEEVSELLKAGIANGVVQPLRTTVFERNQVEDAFRYMAQGKHIGKVLLQVRTGLYFLTPSYDPTHHTNNNFLIVLYFALPSPGPFRREEQYCFHHVSSLHPRYMPYLLSCYSLIHHHWRSGWFRVGAGPLAHRERRSQTSANVKIRYPQW